MSVANIRTDLLAWYDANSRDLPWRAARGERPDPYRVWLSEIMLQQTTAAHASPYFHAFMARWPSIEALAAADPADVMAAWAGLGYYARARNLLECAKRVARSGVGFPSSEETLRGLPGVGAYTAAAIAAIAFDEAANVVDANVLRVIARLYAVETPLPAAADRLTGLANGLVRSERPGDWAQALMDLGAVVCRPRTPVCDACPLARYCLARAGGMPESYPRRQAKRPRPHRHGVTYIAKCDGSVAMILRPPAGLLGGMLGLPTTEWRARPWSRKQALAAAPLPLVWRGMGSVRHVFTNFSLSLEVMAAEARGADPTLMWMALASARAAAPSLFRKALQIGL
jgi:A/G-specific adenine glycosylase